MILQRVWKSGMVPTNYCHSIGNMIIETIDTIVDGTGHPIFRHTHGGQLSNLEEYEVFFWFVVSKRLWSSNLAWWPQFTGLENTSQKWHGLYVIRNSNNQWVTNITLAWTQRSIMTQPRTQWVTNFFWAILCHALADCGLSPTVRLRGPTSQSTRYSSVIRVISRWMNFSEWSRMNFWMKHGMNKMIKAKKNGWSEHLYTRYTHQGTDV